MDVEACYSRRAVPEPPPRLKIKRAKLIVADEERSRTASSLAKVRAARSAASFERSLRHSSFWTAGTVGLYWSWRG